MSALDDVLKDAQRARLIPTVADSRKEVRIVSTFLATLSIVRPFAQEVLGICGVRMGKTSDLRAYTEVEFVGSDGSRKERPDGVLSLYARNARWTALVEAKIDKVELDEDQVRRYGEVAREFGIDAVLTLSNQLAPLPSHVPYSVPKKLSNRVRFLHVSWANVLTHALLTLRDDKGLSSEQGFILEELTRYFKHESSGVKHFDRMNAEWRPLVFGIRDRQPFRRSSPEIENTVASWHQEEKDICLILSRLIGEHVGIRLPRRHQADPELRHRDECDSLVASKELRAAFTVPNTAGDLEVTVDLQRRTISCAMKLNAPSDRKRASARTNWLVRQLRGIDGDDVIIQAFWLGRAPLTQASLSEVRIDPKCLESGRPGATPVGFAVVMIKDLAGRFSGPRTFIEDLENLIPVFYDRIGQNLRPWTPPPPSIDRHDPMQEDSVAKGDRVEASEEGNRDPVPVPDTGLSDDQHERDDTNSQSILSWTTPPPRYQERDPLE